MGACLTEEQVTALVGGSASAGEMSTWNEHLDECEGCAARVADKHAEITTHRQPGTVPAAGMRLGPYEIVAELGAGGMGQVFRAKDTRLDREVAIKVLAERLAGDPDARARFEREGKAVAALSHPNILAIHDVGIDRGISYAVTELLTGETLRQRLRAEALPWRRATEYGIAMANGLAAAHDKGIIHRDLKPDNVFVTSDGVVKILDFGLARTVSAPRPPADADAATVTLETKPGMILGTVNYMSPEQVRGRPTDARSDIFSFGCVLYELVTGRRPFEADSAAETMTAILKHHPPEPHSIGADAPSELVRVITRCLEKKPDERFQSARDLAFTLRTVLTDSDVSQPTVERTAPAGRDGRWVVAAVVAVAIVAGAYLLRPQGSRGPTAGRGTMPLTSFVGVEQGPSWSPDASMVAFSHNKFGHGDIFVMTVATGSLLRLTDHPADDFAVRWSPKGTWLTFLSDHGTGADLYLIPPLGGAERKLAETNIPWVEEPGTGMRALGAMPWSPDETVLLVSQRQATGATGISKVDVATGRSTPLTTPPAGTSDLAASWSRGDGEWIAFVRRRAGRGDLWLIPAAGGTPAPLLQDEHDNGTPAWTPDGERIVFSSDRGGPQHIWQIDLASRQLQPLTSGPGDNYAPVVAPDGRIAYCHFFHQTDLYVLSVEGGGPPERLTKHTHDNFAGRICPTDANLIVYHSTRTGDAELWLLDRRTGDEVRLTHDPARDAYPDFSPDGKRIVFASDRGGPFQLWTMDITRRDPQRLTDQAITLTGARFNFFSTSKAPRWAPDGKAIGFLASTQKGVAFWTVDVDGTNARPRLDGVEGFDWYRDSRRVVYTRRATDGSGTMEMCAADLETDTTEVLLEEPHGELIVSPDGSAVTYCHAVSHLNMDLFLLELKAPAPNALPKPDGEPRQLTHGEGTFHIHNGGWDPTSKHVVYTRDLDHSDIWIIAKP